MTTDVNWIFLTPAKENPHMSYEEVETAMAEEIPARKGPKPNPFVRLAKAQAKAAKARAAYAKVAKVAEALELAEAEEQEALAALQEAVEAAGVSASA